MKRVPLAQRKAIEMAVMRETTTKARPAKHISFTKKTFARLENYMAKHFAGHRALSILVDEAVSEYLDRHEGNGRIE